MPITYRQNRLDIYKKYIQELVDKGFAYYCFCTEDRLTEMRRLQKASGQIPKYDRHCLHLSKKKLPKI
jgi:glutamyl/glutaminyl-tRNA synthetase